MQLDPASLMARKPPPAEVCPADLRPVFGANLRAARKALGLTQTDIGEKVGLQKQYIGQVELGRKNLSLSTMQSLAAAVGLEVSVMLERKHRPKK
jgi:transcriptional regulator with XRE-family HTH domain